MKKGVKTLSVGILCLLGAIIGPFLVILPLILNDSSEEQFLVPGTTEVEVEKAGEYHLWNHYQTVFEGKSYRKSEALPDGLEISIKDEDGKTLELTGGGGSSSRSGSDMKVSIGSIEVKKPGKLVISVTGDFEKRIFSFSEFGVMKIVGMIFGAGILSIILVPVGFGFLIWGIVKLVSGPKKPPAIPSP